MIRRYCDSCDKEIKNCEKFYTGHAQLFKERGGEPEVVYETEWDLCVFCFEKQLKIFKKYDKEKK